MATLDRPVKNLANQLLSKGTSQTTSSSRKQCREPHHPLERKAAQHHPVQRISTFPLQRNAANNTLSPNGTPQQTLPSERNLANNLLLFVPCQACSLFLQASNLKVLTIVNAPKIGNKRGQTHSLTTRRRRVPPSQGFLTAPFPLADKVHQKSSPHH
jgi:hypothetical protein